MNKHPYLRAYLAGIAVPTVFLLVIMTSYTVIRYVWDVPIAIERVIVFPMAAVPNAWGCGTCCTVRSLQAGAFLWVCSAGRSRCCWPRAATSSRGCSISRYLTKCSFWLPLGCPWP